MTLPEKSILITMDDANASNYTRVYPLLLATRMPAIIAAPGAWMVRGHGPEGESVLTWAQAREMQQSGLVEFASHGYDLHGAIRANPQESQLPAFACRIFDPARGYEDDEAYRRRVMERLAAVDRGDDARTGTGAASHRLALWPLHAERRRDRGGPRLSLRAEV